MAKLVWDAVGEHLYETGVRNGVLYPYQTGSNAGYNTGVAWNGLTSVTESPSGADETKLWADDIKYLSLRAAEEFGGTIEAYTYPDEWAECDGSVNIMTSGNTPSATGITLGQQPRKMFGLCYRTVIGNDVALDAYGYKLHLIYGCTASPSQRAYQTINDSPEAITFSWEFSSTPVAVDVTGTSFAGTEYKPVSCITIDSTKADPTKLAALEAILYGGENATARLPLPKEVIQTLGE